MLLGIIGDNDKQDNYVHLVFNETIPNKTNDDKLSRFDIHNFCSMCSTLGFRGHYVSFIKLFGD